MIVKVSVELGYKRRGDRLSIVRRMKKERSQKEFGKMQYNQAGHGYALTWSEAELGQCCIPMED